MRTLITADIHNGYPGKLQDCIWSMEIMRQYAEKNGITDVIVCGDLFNDRTSLEINTLNAVYDQLKKNVACGQTWHCFVGNHDMFLKNSWECNSIHIFGDVLKIYEGITSFVLGETVFRVLPFIHYESTYMEELKKIEEIMSPDDVLLTHIGINSATLNECFSLKHWSVVEFTTSKFNRVFTGHFHCHQKVGENAWYPGSPIPFRFDEGVVDHGFIIFDTETREVEFIKIFEIAHLFSDYRPPDYITIVDEDLEQWIEAVTGNHVRVKLTREYTTNELSELKSIIRDKNGAKSVSWVQMKREMDEVIALQNQLIGLSTMASTFEAWITHDEPKSLSRETLMALFAPIQQEADERNISEENEDGA